MTSHCRFTGSCTVNGVLWSGIVTWPSAQAIFAVSVSPPVDDTVTQACFGTFAVTTGCIRRYATRVVAGTNRQQPTTDGSRCRYRCPRQHHLPGPHQLQTAYPGTGSCAMRATLVPPILGGATAARHLISCGAPLCGTAGIGSFRARLGSHEARHEDTSHGAPHAHPGTLPELVRSLGAQPGCVPEPWLYVPG